MINIGYENGFSSEIATVRHMVPGLYCQGRPQGKCSLGRNGAFGSPDSLGTAVCFTLPALAAIVNGKPATFRYPIRVLGSRL